MDRPWESDETGEPVEQEDAWRQDETWRGDLHPVDESWRGDANLPDWPEESAGPEYWLFKDWRDQDQNE